MDNNVLKPVVRIERDELARNFKFRDNADYVQDISIVSVEDISKYSELPQKASIGDTFIQSPFDPSIYWPLEKFEFNIICQKAAKMVEIAQLLGVAHYEYSAILETLQEKKIDFEADGKYKMVSSGIKITDEERKRTENKYHGKNDFLGLSRPSEEEYQQAIELAKIYCLYNETDVNTLIKLRDPQKRNLQTHYDIQFDSTSEANRLLDIAFNLNIMPNVFNLSASFHESTKYVKKINIHFVLDFPKD